MPTLKMSTFKVKPKIFNDIYIKHCLRNNKHLQIYFGGSSSGKSHAIAQRLVLDCLKGRNYLVIRKCKSTIRKSVWNEIVSKIYSMDLESHFSISKTEFEITCHTGGQILFYGCDDPEKIKSILTLKGVLNDIWIEEATELSREEFKSISKRLRGKSNFLKRITMSFNPIYKTHWIYNEFFAGLWDDNRQYIEDDNISILKTTYKDNKFLAKEDIYNLENEKDKYWHDVYTLGKWGVIGSVIFKNWSTKIFDTENFDNYRNGIDWGFAKDEFAFIRIAIDKKNKTIYICDEVYQTDLLNNESAKIVKNIIGNELVICDSSEPKSIQEYKNYGLNAIGAEKGKGSIENGIKFLQEYQFIINKKCINFINEISQYKYIEDKDGNVLPRPIDKNNHLIDALRYAVEKDITKLDNDYSEVLNYFKRKANVY